MAGVLLGFGVVLILIGIGFAAVVLLPQPVTARIQDGLTPTIYYITNPALMLVLLAETDIHAVVGVYVPIALLTALAAAVVFIPLSLFVLRRPLSQAVSGSMAASYVNAGNIGLPIALFAAGSALPAVSVLMAQLLVIAPIYLTIFSFLARGQSEQKQPLWKTVVTAVANPVSIAAVAGAGLALAEWTPPEVIWQPLDMLGHSSIPLLLLVFGMSLYGQRPLRSREILGDLVLGTVTKLALMPVAAWLLGWLVFDLSGMELFGVVAMAALPTAQNVYLFATQFRLPTLLVRDTIFASSFLSLPVILLISLLLAPT
ncbi:MAG: AEC family transporter [Micrococcaceae bacterium]